MEKPKLYVIGTPIGNRDDITLRALSLLKTLPIFFAEDSREFNKLLSLYGIELAGRRVHSYANHNMKEATQKAIEILQSGSDIGFVSDRGTPGISDPGALVVKRAREAGFIVIPIPGVSAVTTLLSIAGMEGNAFRFDGFFPRERKAQEQWATSVKASGIPACFFESAQRIISTLRFLAEKFSRGEVLMGREMTKSFETYSRFSLSEFDSESIVQKGEFAVLLIPGEPSENQKDMGSWHEEILWRLASEKDWSKRVANRFLVSAQEVYNALQKEKKRK